MEQTNVVDSVFYHLHPARLDTYLRAANGDRYLALRLYLWNQKLAATFHTELGALEVVLRNAIDRELRKWNAAQID